MPRLQPHEPPQRGVGTGAARLHDDDSPRKKREREREQPEQVEKLHDLFDMKSRVLECILTSDPPGGNSFKLPHRSANDK